MKKFIYIVIAIALFSTPFPSTGSGFSIVAVVNGDVITNFTLEQRIYMAIRSTGISDSPNARERIRLQMLESLIDETLQSQEAKRRNVSISDQEMAKAISSIEKQNNLQPGEFDKFIKKHALNEAMFLEQVKAQLLWQKMVLKTMSPKIFITDIEINEFIDSYKRTKTGEFDYSISEILLPVIVPEQEANAQALAEKLVEELRSGASFSSFAKQFSRSGAAQNGGKIGWIHESDINQKIKGPLSKIEPGQITPAIRTSAGYIIMRLDERRKSELEKQPPTKEQAKEYLTKQRMELEARKFMKNLRRAAYIERRV